jgi:hypothetical protein
LLTNHARVLLCITHDPGGRLRDIAAMVWSVPAFLDTGLGCQLAELPIS